MGQRGIFLASPGIWQFICKSCLVVSLTSEFRSCQSKLKFHQTWSGTAFQIHNFWRKKKIGKQHSGTVRSESESSQWKVFIVIAFKVMFFSLREYTVIGKKRRFLSLGSFMKRQAPDNCSREMNCLRKKHFLWIF